MSLSFVSLFKVGSFVYPYIREMFRDIGKSKSRKKVTKPENHRLRTALVIAGIVSVLGCIYLTERLLTVSAHEVELGKKIAELQAAASAAEPPAAPASAPEPVTLKKPEAVADAEECTPPVPSPTRPPKRKIKNHARNDQDASTSTRVDDLVDKLKSIE